MTTFTTADLPACPFLPAPNAAMSWRDLRAVQNDADFHATACRYAHFLWFNATPARAILALCRALYCSPVADAPPPPGIADSYRAFAWLLSNAHRHPGFLGNPRVSFAHQATRLQKPNPALNRPRAWLLWHFTRALRPDLQGDPRCPDANAPPLACLEATLDRLGFPNEGACAIAALRECQSLQHGAAQQ